MRDTVMTHHILSHQPRHQPAGLFRTEDIDPLFPDVDIVATREDYPVKLRDKGDRRCLAKLCQLRIGIMPQGVDVDIEMRGSVHEVNPAAPRLSCKAAAGLCLRGRTRRRATCQHPSDRKACEHHQDEDTHIARSQQQRGNSRSRAQPAKAPAYAKQRRP